MMQLSNAATASSFFADCLTFMRSVLNHCACSVLAVKGQYRTGMHVHMGSICQIRTFSLSDGGSCAAEATNAELKGAVILSTYGNRLLYRFQHMRPDLSPESTMEGFSLDGRILPYNTYYECAPIMLLAMEKRAVPEAIILHFVVTAQTSNHSKSWHSKRHKSTLRQSSGKQRNQARLRELLVGEWQALATAWIIKVLSKPM